MRDLPTHRSTASERNIFDGEEFSELDGARNCVAGNDHVSRSDNRENNCTTSRITEACRTETFSNVKRKALLYLFIILILKYSIFYYSY